MGLLIRTAAATSILLVTAAQGQRVVINEIHFESLDKTVAEEFIELHNPDPIAMDLSNWQFTDGVAFAFPEGVVVPSGAYIVVAEDPEALDKREALTAMGIACDGVIRYAERHAERAEALAAGEESLER